MSREIDAEVAEKVFGWHVGGTMNNDPEIYSVPQYSSNILLAWEVVEKMLRADEDFRVARFETGMWGCAFRTEQRFEMAGTAPLAICLAALSAAGEL